MPLVSITRILGVIVSLARVCGAPFDKLREALLDNAPLPPCACLSLSKASAHTCPCRYEGQVSHLSTPSATGGNCLDSGLGPQNSRPLRPSRVSPFARQPRDGGCVARRRERHRARHLR